MFQKGDVCFVSGKLAFVFICLGVLTSVHSAAGQTASRDTLRRSPGRFHADTTARFLQVNRIFIIGNRITRDQIIMREMSLKQGDIVYSADLGSILDLDKKKLINTRLFNTVEIKMLELETGKVDLLIDLDERWYTFPAPLFELSDRNFNEWWQNYNHDLHRVNYGFRLYQFNMRGRNETLRFLAQFGFQRKFELLYRFPYIDRKQKHGLTIDLGYHESKNVAVRTMEHKYEFLPSDNILRRDRSAGLTYTYRKSFYRTHTAKIEYRDAFVQDTVIERNPIYFQGEGVQRQRYTWLTYQFNADHRDFLAYPLKGYQFTFGISKYGIFKSDDLDKFDVSVIYSKYFDLGKNFYLSNNFNVYWSTPDDVPYTNFGVLGLRRQFVRGYEIYVLEGPYFALNKTTFKKLIFSQDYHLEDMPIKQFRHVPLSIYFKTYADFGFVENYPYYANQDKPQNVRLTGKLLSGVGFGFDVVGSYDIVLRFEYSFNAEGEDGFFFHVKKEF